MQRPRPSCSIHLSRRSRRSPPHRPMPVTRQPRRTDWTDMAGIGVRHVNRKGSYDLAVLGAGSAGFSTSITAAEQGAKIVLVCHGTLGATCVYLGLLPSNTLTHHAERPYVAHSTDQFPALP